MVTIVIVTLFLFCMQTLETHSELDDLDQGDLVPAKFIVGDLDLTYNTPASGKL